MKYLFKNHFLRVMEARKLAFLATFFVVVFISYAILYAIDFIPEAPKDDNNGLAVASDVRSKTDSLGEDFSDIDELDVDPLPRRIIFDSLDKEVTVVNPISNNIADLDEALLGGVVRHPDSADFSTEGNVFILGHSSYLPTVFNKNFQAFNGIQSLTWGDLVRLQSSDTEYIYRVERVYKARASEVVVPTTPGEARLTLATCNTFGAKEDRFIVEAELIDTKSL